jgi:hypothetical protein
MSVLQLRAAGIQFGEGLDEGQRIQPRTILRDSKGISNAASLICFF